MVQNAGNVRARLQAKLNVEIKRQKEVCKHKSVKSAHTSSWPWSPFSPGLMAGKYASNVGGVVVGKASQFMPISHNFQILDQVRKMTWDSNNDSQYPK
jgi:hypothetical protein